MNAFWKQTTSIFFSLLGLAFIMAVWAAGNHDFGFFSEIWRAAGIKGLILLSFVAFIISIAFASTGTDAKPSVKVASITTLVICALPFVFFVVVLALRFLLDAD